MNTQVHITLWRIILITLLVATSCIASGYIAGAMQDVDLEIEHNEELAKILGTTCEEVAAPLSESGGETEPTPPQGQFVASKNGKKYYPSDCSSANRIKEENRVYFTTEEEASSAGYEPTSACK